jgi:ring-1,2-phenylacetyl-CoA epoxidase subunit PaaE
VTTTSATHAPVFHSLAVAEVRRETADAVVMTLAVPPELEAEYRFAAGQHLTLRRMVDGHEVRRNYSVCSPVGGPLRVAVKRVPGGEFSEWANGELKPGDVLDVMTPTGRFTCVLGTGPRGYAALAAGSGITPVLSIVHTLLRDQPDAHVSLVYVNRTVADTMLVEELEDLRNRYLGRFLLSYMFTREPGAVDLLTGRPDRERLHALITAGLFPDDASQYFLCGPEPLVALTREVLHDQGVDPSCVHSELFMSVAGSIASHRRPTSDTAVATATAVLNGRSSTFPVREGETVLAAGLRVRSELPFSCTAGVCSTCRALVREGSVDMEVCYGLEPEEVNAGYVLTCQARPTTPTVIVDYDV